MQHDRKESNEYYLCNSNKYGNDNGPTFFVLLVLCDISLAYKHIKPADVDKNILISFFVSNLLRGKRILFGFILDNLKDDNNKNEEFHYKNKIDEYIITRIPLDDSDLRQYYLDGTNSIMTIYRDLMLQFMRSTHMFLLKYALLIIWERVIYHQTFLRMKRR